MVKGDVCNYKIKVTSSASRYPAFEISGLTNVTSSNYLIKYFEFDDTEDGTFLPNSNNQRESNQFDNIVQLAATTTPTSNSSNSSNSTNSTSNSTTTMKPA